MRRFFYFITTPFRFIFKLIRGIIHWFITRIRGIHFFFTHEIEDSPLPDALAKAVQNPQGIFENLNDLRKHLIRMVLAVALTTGLSLVFNHQILTSLSAPLPGGLESLVAIEVTEPIGTVMRVALLSGFALAFPYIAFEVWWFMAPGLHAASRRWGLLAIPISVLFFLGGMAFSFYVLLPAALPFMLNFMGIATIPRPSNYIVFVTGLMFWIGVAFEFPLVIFLLAKLRLVSARQLIQQWRLAMVIIAVIAAMVTPTVDPVNMALVMGPLIVLYFLSIGLAMVARRGQ